LPALVLAAGALACEAPGGPGSTTDWDWRPKTDGGTVVDPGPRVCSPARSSEPIRARANAMSAEVMPRDRTMFTEQLFDLVFSHCGGCHVTTNQGNFQMARATFSRDFTDVALARIKESDPAKVMPPLAAKGKPYNTREPGDPVVELVSLLEAWMAQQKPPGVFTIPSGAAGDSTMRYLLSSEVGLGLTNLGDCVPSRAMVGISQSTMVERDAFFAAAQTLPDTLEETDLSTLDGTMLAEQGVIAFAPGYPLWSDTAGKLRHIRVPRGQSVRFNKEKQQFQIPPNTRFYKTFLKKVVDRDGNESFRKIETRLIVARPDRKLADGTSEPTALFGTYIWNDDETDARLLKLPLRDGNPFTDSLLIYATDEPHEQSIRDSNPQNLAFELKKVPGLMRHYAIPGSTRCVQCHMGSPDGNFVLGFLPLQIHRRPTGVGGTYEAVGDDELNQLQRLIDYGIISGMTSAADIVPLESSQGSRKPRNDHELTAQAYLLGNCAHCHNPRGFPSVKNPELKEMLDFLPGPEGGIFQFPLERYSPLRKRGPGQDVPIPYITPSLRDYPIERAYDINSPKKYITSCACQNDAASTGVCIQDSYTQFACRGRRSGTAHIIAPWRSLIYRNVDTPFMYADDYTIFPHMPMHTPGFDCRAPKIMGDWMASIPAVRKHPEIPENAVPDDDDPLNGFDDSPQPYVEVKPGDPGYAATVEQTERSLYTYHNIGGHYDFCPDQSDIVDPLVLSDTTGRYVVPESREIWDPTNPEKLLWPALGPPNRGHWVVTDLTDPSGDWYPRRADWERYVVKGEIESERVAATERTQREWELDQQTALITAVRSVTLTTELRALALTELPFGLWEQKPACDFSSIPKVSSFATSSERPRWIDRQAPPGEAPVYMQSPGAALYANICFNCHGPQADSKGLLSEAMMNMTGGIARVGNFRDGLFGPVSMPGANRQRIFGPAAGLSGGTPDDWAARYMAWMALGGTKVRIPASILSIVGVTRVIGESRSNLVGTQGSANMLNLARELCGHVVPVVPQALTQSRVDLESRTRMFWKTGMVDFAEFTGLIGSNADAEMWLRICSLGNRQIVRVVSPANDEWRPATGAPKQVGIRTVESLYWADGYPASAPVMDHRGRVTEGIDRGNLFPMCVKKPTVPADQTAADQYLDANRVGPDRSRIPYCPETLFAADESQSNIRKWQLKSRLIGGSTPVFADAELWAIRGAVNAGLAVFLYVDQLERGATKPRPPFNRCEELPRIGSN
jgi:mono/diheme cytochrome c family protein